MEMQTDKDKDKDKDKDAWLTHYCTIYVQKTSFPADEGEHCGMDVISIVVGYC